MKKNPSDFVAVVGIDWADRKHDLCLKVAGCEQREFSQLSHRPEAIDDWANALRQRFGNQPVAVGVELRKGPLINALVKYEHLVLFPIDPIMLARLRRAFSPSGAKSDPSDASLAVDVLLQHPEQLRPSVTEDARTRQLQALVEQRRGLVELRVKLTNQLTANLKGYFPQAFDCFDDLDTLVALDFLSNWPSLGMAKQAQARTLTGFYHQHNVRGRELIEGRIQRLKAALALTNDAGVLLPGMQLTKTLVSQLRPLLRSIEHYDGMIAKTLRAHPDHAIFESLPGAGPVFAARLLAAFGTDRERFSDALAMQKYLGIAPVKESSGNSTWIHWRWSCPKFLRQSIIEWAGMSMRYSLWAQTFHRQQRERGKSHHVAIRSLAFKWLRILFRCWQERRPYDEARYLLALQKRHSPLLAAMANSAGVTA